MRRAFDAACTAQDARAEILSCAGEMAGIDRFDASAWNATRHFVLLIGRHEPIAFREHHCGRHVDVPNP